MHTPNRTVTRFIEPERVDETLAYAQRLINRCTIGRIDLHFDTRTVTLTDVTGDTAMRLTNLIAQHDAGDPTSGRWGEHCDPETSNALDRWINIEPARALTSDWHPERLVIPAVDRQAFVAAYRLLDTHEDEANFDDDRDRSRVDDYSTLYLHMRASRRHPFVANRIDSSDPDPEDSAFGDAVANEDPVVRSAGPEAEVTDRDMSAGGANEQGGEE